MEVEAITLRLRATVALAVVGTALLVAVSAAAPAMGRERLITVQTPPAPGPGQFNRVTVRQFGNSSARRVLVLMPGTQGGAGDFTLDARYLVKHVPGLQV